MGYTHYWSFNEVKRGSKVETEKKYQRAISDCAKVVRAYYQEHRGLSGFTAHTEPGQYLGLEVNGARDERCETLAFRERYRLATGGSDFCKTNRYPYDTVVTACLAIMAHHMGSVVSVSSDGDRSDWDAGVTLARSVLGVSVANPIPVREPVAPPPPAPAPRSNGAGIRKLRLV
jgi:hypothetical protein